MEFLKLSLLVQPMAHPKQNQLVLPMVHLKQSPSVLHMAHPKQNQLVLHMVLLKLNQLAIPLQPHMVHQKIKTTMTLNMKEIMIMMPLLQAHKMHMVHLSKHLPTMVHQLEVTMVPHNQHQTEIKTQIKIMEV